MFSSFGLGYAPIVVPIATYLVGTSCAERKYGAAERDVNLIGLVAASIYVPTLPLMLFLVLLCGYTRWPWR